MPIDTDRICPVCQAAKLDSHEGSEIIFCPSCNAIFKLGIEHFNFTEILRDASRSTVLAYGNEEEKTQWPFKP